MLLAMPPVQPTVPLTQVAIVRKCPRAAYARGVRFASARAPHCAGVQGGAGQEGAPGAPSMQAAARLSRRGLLVWGRWHSCVRRHADKLHAGRGEQDAALRHLDRPALPRAQPAGAGHRPRPFVAGVNSISPKQPSGRWGSGIWGRCGGGCVSATGACGASAELCTTRLKRCWMSACHREVRPYA